MEPKLKKISSENNAFQHLLVLKENRNKRYRFQEFLVEGVRPINSALAHGWEFTAFYYGTDRKLSDWARGILNSSKAENHYAVAPSLMQKLSDKEETSELLAAVRMRPDDLQRIRIHPNLLVVILDRPNSPRNLGASIRSCDAFGADGVIITGHAADIYQPETVRSSMGSLFAQTVVRVAAHSELLAWIEKTRETLGTLQIVGSSSKANLFAADLRIVGPTILVAGNETFGMSAAGRELCDTIVAIPQCGWASSLNVSCALSILLYEITKQRVPPPAKFPAGQSVSPKLNDPFAAGDEK